MNHPEGEYSSYLADWGTLSVFVLFVAFCQIQRPFQGSIVQMRNPHHSAKISPSTSRTSLALTAFSKTSCSPREGTRPTRFPRNSTFIVGPVPSPGAFFNGLLRGQAVGIRAANKARRFASRRLSRTRPPGPNRMLPHRSPGCQE